MMDNDPYKIFTDWFNKASKSSKIKDATAMSLATASQDAIPSLRIVLLKGYDKHGFRFYTN